jgi:ribonuclease P protein component
VLPGEARLTRSQDFTAALRGGRRAGRPLVVLHLGRAGRDDPVLAADPVTPAKVGFVTSKAVGPAVVRNRVRRRLRHVMADRLGQLPLGTLLVVRALPPSAGASSAELAADVDRALVRLVGGR